MSKLYQCSCRYCGATFQRKVPFSTLCDNLECRKKAKAENDKKYRESEIGKATREKNRKTEKAIATRKRYEQTEAYKKSKSERAKIYRQNPHVQELDRVRKLRYYYRHLSQKYNLTKEGADAITLEQFKSFYSSNICHYCGAEISGKNKTIDHKIPISKGGTNAIENLCVCCRKCNSAKKDKTEAEYLAEVV